MALSTLILTGASGFVGRNFLLANQDRYRIYAIARRPQQRSGVPAHPNIKWIQVDIGSRSAMKRVGKQIEREGGAEYVVHLAAFYDFENEANPEFHHTNVQGTWNVLEQARMLAVSHVIFASSIAACSVPAPGEAITEASPPDAQFPYAISKRAGEEMMREYSQYFRCSVVRLAAVFSDWCEYAPLYVFLSTWLSRSWKARVLGGKGDSAVPYIHTRDINRLLLTLLERTDLPSFGIYIASPGGATSHRDLFERSTHFYFGRTVKPFLMPKPLAGIGVVLTDLLGRLINRRPFERPWMMEYVDTSLTVDASQTTKALGWEPTPRLHILRRTLFLIEKMRTDPHEWLLRNERAMKRPPARPALVIHDAMMGAKEAISDAITAYLQSPVRQSRFPNYRNMSYEDLRWYIGIVYELLMAAVRTGDRTLLLHYVHNLSRLRFEGGFPASELCDALLVISEITVEELLYKPEVAEFSDQVRDAITHAIALAIDGAQDAYETLAEMSNGDARALSRGLSRNGRDLEQIVGELNAFYRPSPDDRNLANGDGVTSVR